MLHFWPRFPIQYLDVDVAGLKRCHGVVARYLVLNAFHIKPIDMFTMSSFPTSPSHAARHTQGSVHPSPSNQCQEIMKPSNQQTHVTIYIIPVSHHVNVGEYPSYLHIPYIQDIPLYIYIYPPYILYIYILYIYP